MSVVFNFRFNIVYDEKPGPNVIRRYLFNSTNPLTTPQTKSFFLGGLTPKTIYTFSIIIYYATSSEPFIWAQDSKFTFETLGDVPTAPGQPFVKQAAPGIYHISWEVSKDNGAPIEEYSLEGYKTNSHRLRKRSTNATLDAMSSLTGVSTTMSSFVEMNHVEEKENITTEEEQWTVFYTGLDNYWLAEELGNDLYRFRVRAKNAFGYSGYSLSSEEVSSQVHSAQFSTQMVGILVAVGVSTIFVIFICICIGKDRNLSYFIYNT